MIQISELEPNLFYSPPDIDNDTRPASIETFIPSDYPDKIDELAAYCNSVDDNHRLRDNYLNLDFTIFALVSIWRLRGNIVGFATGWARDTYPTKSIRLLNRIYHDPISSRVAFTRELLRPATFSCIQQQLILSDRLGFAHKFISREERAAGFFMRFIHELDTKTTHSWEYKRGPFLVAPDPLAKSCWQSIGVTSSSNNDTFWKEWTT